MLSITQDPLLQCYSCRVLIDLFIASKSDLFADQGFNDGGGLLKSMEETVLKTLSHSHSSNIFCVMIGGFCLISSGLKPVNGCEGGGPVDFDGKSDCSELTGVEFSVLEGLPSFALESSCTFSGSFTALSSDQCLSSYLSLPLA